MEIQVVLTPTRDSVTPTKVGVTPTRDSVNSNTR